MSQGVEPMSAMIGDMDIPPPRFNPADTQGRIRRSPRGRHTHESVSSAGSIRTLVTQAMSVGTGDLAETDSTHPQRAKSARVFLTGTSLYVFIAGVLVVTLAVIILSVLSRESAAQVPITTVEESAPDVATETTQETVAPVTPTSTEIVVHVSGAVAHPGLVTLTVPARVNDAVLAAGGLAKNALPETVNLAEPITDGTHIHIPVAGDESDATANNAFSGSAIQNPGINNGSAVQSTGADNGSAQNIAQININTATQSELENIPGVGPVTAAAIITWREENGNFSTVDQLLEVSGIGEKTLETMRSSVTVD